MKADLAVIQTHLCRWLGLFHTLTAAGDPTQRRMLIVHHVAAASLCVALKERLGELEADAAKSKSRALWITHEIEEITTLHHCKERRRRRRRRRFIAESPVRMN